MANPFFSAIREAGNRIVGNTGSLMMGSSGRMIGNPSMSGTRGQMRGPAMSGSIAVVGQRAIGGTRGERMRRGMSAGSRVGSGPMHSEIFLEMS
jgi:hypothetical protein